MAKPPQGTVQSLSWMLLPRGYLLDLAPTSTLNLRCCCSVPPVAPSHEFQLLPEPGSIGADSKHSVKILYCPYTALAVGNRGGKFYFGINLERIDILVLFVFSS